MKIDHLDHLAITVRDVEASAKWYENVLGLKRRYTDVWGPVPLMICAGDTCLALFPSENENPESLPNTRNTITMRHFAFRVNRNEFKNAQSDLKEKNIDFRFEDHTVSHSIYFNDPDGHHLEITTYEI